MNQINPLQLTAAIHLSIADSLVKPLKLFFYKPMKGLKTKLLKLLKEFNAF